MQIYTFGPCRELALLVGTWQAAIGAGEISGARVNCELIQTQVTIFSIRIDSNPFVYCRIHSRPPDP